MFPGAVAVPGRDATALGDREDVGDAISDNATLAIEAEIAPDVEKAVAETREEERQVSTERREHELLALDQERVAQ
jgi:hypothetical protein